MFPMDLTVFNVLFRQKARLARIRMAKNASGAAFIQGKKRNQERMQARESGLEEDEFKDEDVFELQHHHLLTCLERTTVSPFVMNVFVCMLKE